MLYASFVRPEGVFDSWFNRLAARATGGPFCHSEFVFRWDEEQFKEIRNKVAGFAKYKHHKGPIDVALYVIWGDTVKYRVLNGHGEFFSVPEKDMIRVSVPWETEMNTVCWLWNQLGSPYDKTGALLSVVPLRAPSAAYDKYFCSQLMACALQRLGKIKQYNPGALTPNALHRAMSSGFES
ncbi:MAG: hypothetical protein CME58_12710 [Halieaceae bacterium]|nr:hypothetical protein [Halieaceae bacterium]|tara:strand:- start:1176 stop:1718 length:543 start_codon:yes stop_codon:yes gene_type:complete